MRRAAIPLALALVLVLGCSESARQGWQERRGQEGAALAATVTRVVDGDTIQLDTGDRVRLLAVDAPETVHPHKEVEHFGKEAADFTRRALTGERVLLVLDQNAAARKHRDRYGRLLAYVYRERDNLDFNAELVKQGYAYAYLKYPTERGEEFLGYQREARRTRRGLWAQPAEAGPAEEVAVYVTKHGTKYHQRNCPTLKWSKTVRPLPLEEARHSFGRCSACSPPP